MSFDRHTASAHQTSSGALGTGLRSAVAIQLRWLGRLPAVAWRLGQAPGEIVAAGARAVLFSRSRAPVHSRQAASGADLIYLDHFRKDARVLRQR